MNKNTDLRIFDNLLILTFVIGLFLPLLFTHNREVSDIEKRKLATFPQLKFDKKTITQFPSKFEKFFNDHFGFRDQLAQIYSLSNLMLKNSSNPNVLIGENDWMFYTGDNSIEDYRKNAPLTPKQLSIWEMSLEAKYIWLKQQGIQYLFVIAPDKHSIYSEYMPSRVNQIGKQTRLDQLLEYMHDSEVPILDLRKPLLQAKNKGQLYYKNDTHWNDFGAAIAQYEIIQYIHKYYPNLYPTDYHVEDFSWSEITGGDMTSMLNLSSKIKEVAPQLRKPLSLCNKQLIEKNNDPLKSTFSTECHKNAPKALIFRDSFFVSLQPYISQYFATSIYVWIYPDFNQLKQDVEFYHPDIVIEERIERLLKEIPTPPTSQN